MATEDQVKQDGQNQDLGSGLQSIATAALSVTAGAAVFYRVGGEYLGDPLNNVTRAARIALYDFNKTGPIQRTPEEWMQFFKNVPEYYQQAKKQRYKDFILDPQENTVFTLLQANEKVANDKLYFAEAAQLYHKDMLGDIYQSERFKNMPQNLQDGLRDTLERVYQNRDNPAVIQDVKRSLSGTLADHRQEVEGYIDDLVAKIKANDLNLSEPEAPGLWYLDNKDRLQHLHEQKLSIVNNPKEYLAVLQQNQKLNRVRNTLLGDRGVTLREVFEGNLKIDGENLRDLLDQNIIYGKNQKAQSAFSVLEEKIRNWQKEYADNPEMRDVIEQILDSEFSSDIRIKGDTVHSLRGAQTLKTQLLELMANTLPGHLFNVRDYLLSSRRANFVELYQGTFNPGLVHEAEVGGIGAGRIARDVISYGQSIFALDENENLVRLQNSGTIHFTSGAVGSVQRLLGNKYDHEQRETPAQSDTSFMHHKLDAHNLVSGTLDTQTAEAEYCGNNLQYFFNPTAERYTQAVTKQFSEEEIYEQQNRLRRMQRFVTQNVYDMGYVSRNALWQVLTPEIQNALKIETGGIRNFSNILNLNSIQEIVEALPKSNGNEGTWFHNENLARLVSTYKKDPQNFEANMLEKLKDRNNFSAGSTIGESVTGAGIMRRELQKEMYFRIFDSFSSQNTDNVYRRMRNLLEEAAAKNKIDGTEALRNRNFMMSAYLEWRTGLSNSINKTDVLTAKDVTAQVYSLLSGETEDKDTLAFQKDFEQFVTQYDSDQARFSRTTKRTNRQVQGAEYQAVHDSISGPLQEILNNENLSIKQKASRLAGSVFGDYQSYLNLQVYKFFDRINVSLNSSKLGEILGGDFSLPLGRADVTVDASIHTGKRTFVEGWKNFGLKRILPAALALTALDFANDAQKQITGTSTETSVRSGAANINLGMRKIMDTFGLTSVAKDFVETNVIAQYLTDSKTFNNEQEEREYYRNGYTPMRRGRFWAFGSAAEFRGGEVDYWRPNALRESTADAYTASVYGDLRNKWSHSLIPTPFNPLSTLNYITDPYYLERWHYYDRPYPLTGPMFQAGTPWGSILNATVGELIKPVQRMHEDELPGGISVKMLLSQINAYTKQKALSRDSGNLIVLQNGRIQPMAFMAYNAPTPSTRIISIHKDNENDETRVYAQQDGKYYGGINASDYLKHVNPDNSANFMTVNEANEPLSLASDVPGDTKIIHQERAPELSTEEKIAIEAGKQGNVLTNVANNVLKEVRRNNQAIQYKAQAKGTSDSSGVYLDKAQGIFIPDKMRYSQSEFQNQIDQESEIEDALHSQQGMDFVHSMATSMKLVSGIYGWMAGNIGEFGEWNRPHIQNAGDIDSFSRKFWDSNIGGIGGDVMEIARRFIPTYARYNAINPLMNAMPDWIPERLRHADPYASSPNGEERLPGRGYETLHRLHPDMYGRYGALDRYAILSDIAPFSEEAKFWKNIAAKTAAQSEEGAAEFKAIRDRAKLANQPQFFNYKFVGRGLDTQTATVSEILGRGKFKIFGSDETYTLAGVQVLNTDQAGTDQVMMKYLQPGQEVTLKIDSNPAYQHMKDTTNSISAAVLANGTNVSSAMVANGDAKYKESDTSAAATIGKYGDIMTAIGTVSEVIAHANIPLIHSQFLRVDSPLESYQRNLVYGTPYQTWSDFWGTSIEPGFEASVASPGMYFLSAATRTTYELLRDQKPRSKWTKAASLAYTFTDRGAFIGSVAGRVIKFGSSGQSTLQHRLRNAGSTVSSILALGVAYQYDNPLYAGFAFARVGLEGAKLAEKFVPLPKHGKLLAAAATAATGLLAWAGLPEGGLKNQRGVWIPERTQEKWLMNDYFDRLTYIKMTALYHKAAAKAKSEEGVDVEKLFRVEEKDRAKKAELKEQLLADREEIKKHPTNASADALTIINKKLQALSNTKTVLRGGEYTRAAVLYKQAAEATMYGLKADASMTEILRALPQEDRDYFMQFITERDESRRKEILQYVSPQLRRALKQMWGMGQSKQASNEEFFRKMKLPDSSWKGWRPDVNLSDVKAKVIKNEGMLFGDFGIYESAYRKPSVINAPNIQNVFTGTSSSLMVKARLEANLKGLGLTGVDVSVEPKPSGGVQMAASIMQALPDSLANTIENAFS